jgi:hypothetical protein
MENTINRVLNLQFYADGQYLPNASESKTQSFLPNSLSRSYEDLSMLLRQVITSCASVRNLLVLSSLQSGDACCQ